MLCDLLLSIGQTPTWRTYDTRLLVSHKVDIIYKISPVAVNVRGELKHVTSDWDGLSKYGRATMKTI